LGREGGGASGGPRETGGERTVRFQGSEERDWGKKPAPLRLREGRVPPEKKERCVQKNIGRRSQGKVIAGHLNMEGR